MLPCRKRKDTTAPLHKIFVEAARLSKQNTERLQKAGTNVRCLIPTSKQNDSQAAAITAHTRIKGGLLSATIGIFADFLGGGPGFLLMPTLVMLGYTAHRRGDQQGNRYSAFIFSIYCKPADAPFKWVMVGLTSVTAMIGAYLGACSLRSVLRAGPLPKFLGVALICWQSNASSSCCARDDS